MVLNYCRRHDCYYFSTIKHHGCKHIMNDSIKRKWGMKLDDRRFRERNGAQATEFKDELRALLGTV